MALIIVSVIFLFDQISKILATKILLLNQPVTIIKGILNFTLVHNRGAAFGMLKNQLPLFIITSAGAITLIYISLKGNRQARLTLYSFALSLILAGALGNLVDRLFFGYVIDFIDFRVWPVFNLADSAITVGAVLLGYAILFVRSQPETPACRQAGNT